ncbi:MULTISPECIES: mechanosensitive ion channel [Tenacibaculum]|uniref:mechanosensitive ion channel n=1 Tax=Tenacibaculum TaxID=104267 RepID=UPI001F0B38D4|nr:MULTISPECIES: mechanosensitive ion channel [Tenacibaculum]MCH3882751.1 mechanosensitive ion channel [Tenacibaculum aquimarinum]MCH3884935.1 mechanosensitive ion channel [Tenacibaculum aquimarinum]MDO6600212.1 mechanosensitive ion channel [Tenacibaculum sp. 1_MG-2023]
MDQIIETYNNLTGSFGAPIAALAIIIIGWFVAGILKRLVKKLIKKSGVDESLSSKKVNFADVIAKLLYYLVMIFVFMLALNKLGMTSVLEPVKGLLDGFLGYIPNIIGAGLVAYIGYMLATIVSELVGLSGDTIQKFAPKLRLPENIDLVDILKKVVFIFIFIPLLISALNILNISSVSEPASEMLQSFFNAIPKVLVATIIMIIFVVGGRFLSELLKDLLDSLNLNQVMQKAGLTAVTGKTNIERLIANIVYAFIILFGLVTAIEKLEFTKLSEMMNTVIELGGNILFGLVILAIGNWVANVASKNFLKSDDNPFVANIIKVAILAIFLAIGLRRMGIADDIINLAFGITLGAVALTVVLAFGLGGREAAGKQMTKILDKFNKK